MISKLDPIKSFDCGDTPQANMRHHSYHNDCINKINELVDAVNEMQTRAENVQSDTESRPENVQKEPITLLDIFNEMGEMYSSLWNKMEDIHHDLKNKGGDND